MNIEARVRRLEAMPKSASATDVAQRTAKLEAQLAELGLVAQLTGKDGGPIDLKRPLACMTVEQLRTVLRAAQDGGMPARPAAMVTTPVP